MIRWAIVDSGPLTAYFDQGDRRHDWVVEQFGQFRAPLISVEPVITETLFLLNGRPDAQDRLLEMIAADYIQLPFELTQEVEKVRRLRQKYADKPMALADACLVRLAEIYDCHAVCTFDSHFLSYRKHGRRPIPLIAPSR